MLKQSLPHPARIFSEFLHYSLAISALSSLLSLSPSLSTHTKSQKIRERFVNVNFDIFTRGNDVFEQDFPLAENNSTRDRKRASSGSQS